MNFRNVYYHFGIMGNGLPCAAVQSLILPLLSKYSLVGKSGIKKRAAYRFGINFRDTAGADHIVPVVHLFLHLGNDFFCLFLFQEKARVLRNDI